MSEKKDSGLIVNFTGDGKGKTSAAMGTVLRSLGYGRRVVVFQFSKSAPTGEKMFFEGAGRGLLVFRQCGGGFSWTDADHKACAEAGWREAEEYLSGKKECDLLVLDELNIALRYKYLDTDMAVSALSSRRKGLDVVITGRSSPKKLREICDVVSVIKKEKHPFDAGIPAKKGIDF